MEIRIKTSDLKPGMFVKQVESHWLSSPWVDHDFRIGSGKDINKLIDFGIEHVFIDPARSLAIKKPPPEKSHKPEAPKTFKIDLNTLPVGLILPIDLYRAKNGAMERVFEKGMLFDYDTRHGLAQRTGDSALCHMSQKSDYDAFIASVNEKRSKGFEGPFLDPAKVAEHVSFISDFFPINPMTLIPGAVPGFDIFEKSDFDIDIAHPLDKPLHSKEKDEWVERDANILIQRKARDSYHHYLIVHKKDMRRGREKAAYIREDSRLIIEDLAENPRSETLMRETKQSIIDLTGMVMENPTTFYGLLKINNYDYYTFTHSVNVATMCVALGMASGISREGELSALGLGAILHDLGKSKVDSALINKPGRLTIEEFEKVSKHVMLGFQMLKNNRNVPELALTPLLEHHETISGSGYPMGLSGSEVSRFGRISAIIDIYDALTTERVYRKAMRPFQALSYLSEHKDEDYDQELFELFVNLLQTQEVEM